LEIRVFGCRRSGNHEIINWISFQSPSPPHFFDCTPNDGGDILLTGKGRGDSGEQFKNLYYPHKSYKHASFEEKEKARKMKKEVLIYNYEDLNLKKLDKKEYPIDREKVTGKSKRRIDVLIIRDIYNWSSSKLTLHHKNSRGYHREDMTHERFEKNRHKLPFFEFYNGWEEDAKQIRGLDYINFGKFIKAWKSHAEEALSITNRLSNLLVINFNRWVLDKTYRKSIIDKIGFIFTDKGHNIMGAVGGGSSFDKYKYAADASQMKLFDRWKFFKDNRLMQNIYAHYPDIVKLSDKLFGKKANYGCMAKMSD